MAERVIFFYLNRQSADWLRARGHQASCASLLMLLMSVLLLLAGCTTTKRESYLSGDASRAYIDGFQNIRMYSDGRPPAASEAYEWLPQTSTKELNILCISGGGSGGAFSVGILSAWTDMRARPDFDVVTGVSTGALIAPFAFLGSVYDPVLKDLYTSGKAGQLVDIDWMAAGVIGSSVLKGGPLRRMVATYMTREMLERVAAEHRKGRRLLVMTTDLDSQRGVVWNMGAIASSESPNSLALFRDVLVASASIPGVFPAVTIKARSGGRTIEELHSDGGASSQLFSIPDQALAMPGKVKLPWSRKTNMYVIVNNALFPEFATTSNKTLSVAGRAYAAMVKSQTRQSLLALYNYSQRSGMDLRVASIDKQIPYSMLDPFNIDYMRALYTLGYTGTMNDLIWKSRPVFP